MAARRRRERAEGGRREAAGDKTQLAARERGRCRGSRKVGCSGVHSTGPTLGCPTPEPQGPSPQCPVPSHVPEAVRAEQSPLLSPEPPRGCPAGAVSVLQGHPRGFPAPWEQSGREVLAGRVGSCSSPQHLPCPDGFIHKAAAPGVPRSLPLCQPWGIFGAVLAVEHRDKKSTS